MQEKCHSLKALGKQIGYLADKIRQTENLRPMWFDCLRVARSGAEDFKKWANKGFLNCKSRKEQQVVIEL
ncbi:hypothetical protein CKK33_06410 [Mucilaginibacter sp. MD40]|nr:hypothetical protein CKK33_06410 [Mucilaginibacter sp. MD40]